MIKNKTKKGRVRTATQRGNRNENENGEQNGQRQITQTREIKIAERKDKRERARRITRLASFGALFQFGRANVV